MKDHYPIILKQQDQCVPAILSNQVRDVMSIDFGGFEDQPDKLVIPARAAENLSILVPVYCNADSSWFKNSDVYTSILHALQYLERIQRPDGTFDLTVTNFYSSPDTGFIVQYLAGAYRVSQRYPVGNETDSIHSKLYQLIYKSAEGMVNGGFHTPNHRWVIASSLMMAYNITGETSFCEAANLYLREGIDCDENGEFTERSSGIYNATNDNALIMLSQETGREQLLEDVRRNLDMMFTYIEPDGTIFTGNSTRQDNAGAAGSELFYPTAYYPLYLYMAWKMKDGRYACMADTILEEGYRRNNLPPLVSFFMLHPEIKNFQMETLPLTADFEKFYPKSGIVRVRRENTSYTLLKNNSRFLFFQAGSLRCYMKLCASFFAVAQFKAQELQKTENGYRLSFTSQGCYRMPLDQPPMSPDWSLMDHSSRRKVNMVELKLNVDVLETAGSLSVHIASQGCDRVPAKVELCFSADSAAEGENFIIHGDAGGSITVKSGFITVKKGMDQIRVGPGFAKHAYTSRMRGSEPRSAAEFTVYFTDYTPVDRNITISRPTLDA